ncbi:MAG TPA: efflux RND transporter periplasmic adaptor subunit [Candidatus Paceibacterota bacterium]|nr:efflux RND transporter periplasmic adaptor subunit [Verrucomicrobiota bacterium]HOX01112.1 efflux RND transporter periplasmic adaptor subunit [Verrucomicrobiota bacterium]HRZ44040.1 efflux RND transporter periplasmic adaptor subunit [Candidatus Paceibacterota bacterium]HRZ91460.1 efflux RND transporter periplasmic adaptor subunit [Candidatus Paceibacterota bacterium]
MLAQPPPVSDELASALDELARLRRFSGPPVEFWPALIAMLTRLAGGSRGLLILREPVEPVKLKKLGEWSRNGTASRANMAFNACLSSLAEQSAQCGHAAVSLDSPGTDSPGLYALGISLPITGQEQCLAAVLLENAAPARVQEAQIRLRMAADIPLAYQVGRTALQAQQDVRKLALVLDILAMVNAEGRFRSAALALCNGVAGQLHCDRVSLGWLERGFVRLKAISRTERFDRRMAAVTAIEVVMEEALDQNEEILWPPPAGASVVCRDHEKFAVEQKSAHVISLPLRRGGEGVAALTCERQGSPFTEQEGQQLRLLCDQAVCRLDDLCRSDRWFGARWLHAANAAVRKIAGPEHAWSKVLAFLGFIALIALFLPVYPYRVEGNFILRSDEVSLLTAPFDGYIQKVEARPGDRLPAGRALLTLHTEHLELEEAAAVADQTRYLREAEKARAGMALAEMRIAEALADQARARLELVRYRIGQSAIRAPFEGVVIEGDLRQRVGAPVRQGEALFKLARIDTLYVEAEINERDAHEILSRSEGEIAFVSQPKLRFPVRVTRVEPAAVPKEKENVFIVRAGFVREAQPWWRPGMSGVCKIDVDQRTLFWILTHRTADFLQLLFWW